jgi:hypothetical protein
MCQSSLSRSSPGSHFTPTMSTSQLLLFRYAGFSTRQTKQQSKKAATRANTNPTTPPPSFTMKRLRRNLCADSLRESWANDNMSVSSAGSLVSGSSTSLSSLSSASSVESCTLLSRPPPNGRETRLWTSLKERRSACTAKSPQSIKCQVEQMERLLTIE